MAPTPLPVYLEQQRLLQPLVVSSRTSSKRKRANELRTSQSPSPASPSGSSSSSSASPSPSSPTAYFQGTVKAVETPPTRSVRPRKCRLTLAHPELERRSDSVAVVEARSTDARWVDSPPSRPSFATLPSLSSGSTLSTISETPELVPDDQTSESPCGDELMSASPPSLLDNRTFKHGAFGDSSKQESVEHDGQHSPYSADEVPTVVSSTPAPSSLASPIDLLIRPHTAAAASSPLSSPPIVVAKIEFHDPILPRRRRGPPPKRTSPPPPPRRLLSRSSSLSSLSSEAEESDDELDEVGVAGAKENSRRPANGPSRAGAGSNSAQSRSKKFLRVKREDVDQVMGPFGDVGLSLQAKAGRSVRGPSVSSATSAEPHTTRQTASTSSSPALSVSRSVTGSSFTPSFVKPTTFAAVRGQPAVESTPRVRVELGPLAHELLNEIVEGLRESDPSSDDENAGRKMSREQPRKQLRRFQGGD